MQWYHRWSPTLGSLDDTPENIWHTLPYDPELHINEPTVFCGIYSLNDFFALWRHKGRKLIWWTGSDIRRFNEGYWLDDTGDIRAMSGPMADWISKYCESWVENDVEARLLAEWGIEASVCPSFLGDVSQYKVSFKPGNKVYASVSGDDFELYCWPEIEVLAKNHPKIEFHLYGNSREWKTDNNNVIVHGRVPKEQFNKEIEDMQGGLRLLKFDGFSEVIAKSILMGQYPISAIPYPGVLHVSEIEQILDKNEPNISARDYYLKELNNYPWIKE